MQKTTLKRATGVPGWSDRFLRLIETKALVSFEHEPGIPPRSSRYKATVWTLYMHRERPGRHVPQVARYQANFLLSHSLHGGPVANFQWGASSLPDSKERTPVDAYLDSHAHELEEDFHFGEFHGWEYPVDAVPPGYLARGRKVLLESPRWMLLVGLILGDLLRREFEVPEGELQAFRCLRNRFHSFASNYIGLQQQL